MSRLIHPSIKNEIRTGVRTFDRQKPLFLSPQPSSSVCVRPCGARVANDGKRAKNRVTWYSNLIRRQRKRQFAKIHIGVWVTRKALQPQCFFVSNSGELAYHQAQSACISSPPPFLRQSRWGCAIASLRAIDHPKTTATAVLFCITILPHGRIVHITKHTVLGYHLPRMTDWGPRVAIRSEATAS